MILLMLALVAALNSYSSTPDADETPVVAAPAFVAYEAALPPPTSSRPAPKPKQAIGIMVAEDRLQFRLDGDFDEIAVPKGAAFIACEQCDVVTPPERPAELRCNGPCILRLADAVGSAQEILCRRGEIVLTGDKTPATLGQTSESESPFTLRAKRITVSLFTGRVTAEGVEVRLNCCCQKTKR